MKPTFGKSGLQTQFDFHQCQLSQDEIDEIYDNLEVLERQVNDFPVHDLHILVERNARSNDYSVKLTLILPGATLVGNDHDQSVHAAFQRCLQGLEENVRAYKERMDRVEERQKQQKGTHHEVASSIDTDFRAVDEAVQGCDYAAFRAAAFGYEEAVRRRAGRWIERYPDMAARIGRDLDLDDIVEAVFLDAFEAYERWPREIRFGDWLDSLIDPAVKSLQNAKENYLDNIRLARSAREAEGGAGVK